MQLKKIFWSLLVVIMILSTVAFSVSAAEESLEFSVAFVATEDSEGNSVAKPGDPVDVSITIKNNPGVQMFDFKLAYDETMLTPVTVTDIDGDNRVMFDENDASGFYYVDSSSYGVYILEPGIIKVVPVELNSNSTFEGNVITIHFILNGDVTGDTFVELYGGTAYNEDYSFVNVSGSKATLAGHNYDEGEYVPATCHAGDYTVYRCVDDGCDASYIIKGENAPINHVGYTEDILAVAPECEKAGSTAGLKCTKCEIDQCEECNFGILVAPVEIPATGHVEYVIDAIDATCLADGRTEGKACAICNVVLQATSVVPATGHHAVLDDENQAKWTIDVPANCSSSGYKHKTCVDCGSAYGYTTINSYGHNKDVKIEAVPATCTAEGLTEGAKCSECGIITVAQQVVDKIAHVEEAIAGFDATCEGKGLTEGKICSVCDTLLVAQDVIPAKGHNNDVVIDGVEATCTSIGLTAGNKCSVCNTITVEQTVIPAKGHTESVLEAVEPTCTSIGLTEGKICDVCGVATVPQTIVEAKGHTEEKIPAVEATCTAAGSTEGVKCSVCDVVLDPAEVVQPKGHTEVEIPAVEPTYSEDGSTEGKQCTTCNTITDATGVIPAKSLAWLWVLIGGVVVAGGLVAVYFFVLRKKN